MGERIDIFCHWIPTEYSDYVKHHVDRIPFMFERALSIPVMTDLDQRFSLMDRYPGYRQIPSLVSPPLERFGNTNLSLELAQVANDAAASLVARHPQRFPTFVASVPVNSVDSMCSEAGRAVKDLGACGVQIFSQVEGHPLDGETYEPFYGLMAELERPIWLHPARGADTPDYRKEKYSKYEIWWSVGWLYESTVAMIRLALSGVFDQNPTLKIITHHAGAFVPAAEGRLGAGMTVMGARTPEELKSLVAHPSKTPVIDTLKRFYTDSATFGSKSAFRSGLDFFGTNHMLFATDMPFGPDQGRHHIETSSAMIEDFVPPADRERIFSENIRELIHLAE
jgi:predicted TIM-barrel fold metal-dependent hydrolase